VRSAAGDVRRILADRERRLAVARHLAKVQLFGKQKIFGDSQMFCYDARRDSGSGKTYGAG